MKTQTTITLWNRVVKKEDGCWEWTGGVTTAGYGELMINKQMWYAHRLSYTENKGNIPNGYQIDHTCENKKCVNPDHLIALSPQEHNRIGNCVPAVNLRKTHCPRGHKYNVENTLIYRGNRICRECSRIRRGCTLPRPETRTHCPSGHEYNIENTSFTKDGFRRCKQCSREYTRRYRQTHTG